MGWWGGGGDGEGGEGGEVGKAKNVGRYRRGAAAAGMGEGFRSSLFFFRFSNASGQIGVSALAGNWGGGLTAVGGSGSHRL